MTNPPEILDVYHGKELVRIDEDFGGWHCQQYTGGYCGGCGACIMAQASYSGHTFKAATRWQRWWRDTVYYPILLPIENFYRRHLRKQDDFEF
jgi:hypothetical protein